MYTPPFPLPSQYAHLAPYTLSFLTGSQAYGLASADSDYDYKYVYFHPALPQMAIIPEADIPVNGSWSTNNDAVIPGEDNQIYRLDFFLRMLMKGNPNAIDIIHYPTEIAAESKDTITCAVYNVLSNLREYVITDRMRMQFTGHVRGVLHDMSDTDWEMMEDEFPYKYAKMVKRVSHAYRLMYTLEGIEKTGQWWNIRDNPKQLADTRRVKYDTSSFAVRMNLERLGEEFETRISEAVRLMNYKAYPEELALQINSEYGGLVRMVCNGDWL